MNIWPFKRRAPKLDMGRVSLNHRRIQDGLRCGFWDMAEQGLNELEAMGPDAIWPGLAASVRTQIDEGRQSGRGFYA